MMNGHKISTVILVSLILIGVAGAVVVNIDGSGISGVTNASIQINESQVTNLVTDLGNKLNITTYSGDFPNSTLSGYGNNFPNATVASKEATWDAKEPAISSSTASKFYGWDKTFKDILINYVSGLQDVLNSMNTSSATNNTASQARDDYINSTKANKSNIGEFTAGTILSSLYGTGIYAANVSDFNATVNATMDRNQGNLSGSNQSILNPYFIDQQNTAVNDTGLVFDMRFDENSTGTATSTKISDSSKYANDGIWNGYTTPNWTAGKYGSALQFDGVNDYVDVPDANNLDMSELITVSFWINTLGMNDIGVITKLTGSAQVSASWAFLGYTDGINFVVRETDAGNPTTAHIPIANGNWHHIVGVADGTNLKIYKDGILYDSVTYDGTIQVSATTLKIGARSNIGTGVAEYFFNGTIDDVRIYNRALSADEIRNLYYSNPLNEKSSFIQTDNFRVVNNSGYNTFNVDMNGTITPLLNNTADVGGIGKNYNRGWFTTIAGGEFADKAPGGYDYTDLWSWNYYSEPINVSNLSEGYREWRTPNIPENIKYAAVKLNTTNGKWDLAKGFGSIESVAIIPNDDELIIDGRLIILGGYKAQVYGNISIGDKLIVSNRNGVLTNARNLIVPTLQYNNSWIWKDLPISDNPGQYNKYNSAQGVSATIVAIALEPYNSNSTGIIKVKVLNT